MASEQKFSTNQLNHSSSPYLRQHEKNPVWWQEWNEETWNHIQANSKLVFLSIGYATCHWCHVMEKDSFEKEDVAKILNDGFVAIKIDREERPDIDHFFMTVVQSLTGNGGWPTSVFLTPEADPIWAGTFLERNQFKLICTQISEIWQKDHATLNLEGKRIRAWFQEKMVLREPSKASVSIPNVVELNADFIKQKLNYFDRQFGGFGGAPKFPQAPVLQLFDFLTDQDSAKMLDLTLKNMAFGTLFDHVGGGFHRYATDDAWLVPHFEKMLYDNVLLAPLYARRAKNNPQAKIIFEETLAYLDADLRSSDGGFYCAEDADSGGVEGGFYLYTTAEIESHFKPETAENLKNTAHLKSEGNFSIDARVHALERQAGYTSLEYPNVIYGSQLKMPELKTLRDRRPRPIRDEKILASWNGLALQGLVHCYKAVGRSEDLESALKLKLFFEQHLLKSDGGIFHVAFKISDPGPELLEDYVWTIAGFLELYDVVLDSALFDKILALQKRQQELFWIEDKNYFRLCANPDLRLRFETQDFYDHAIPSNTSQAMLNLLKIYALTGDQHWNDVYQKLKTICIPFLHHALSAMGSVLRVLNVEAELQIIHIAHADITKARITALQVFQNAVQPQAIVISYRPTTTVTFEVCSLQSCHFKTTDEKQLVEFCSSKRSL